MKIGILTYHAVYNFGANLQALSTFSYLRNEGHDPIIIDFFPKLLEEAFDKSIPLVQANIHKLFLQKHFILTKRCRDAKDIANEITLNNIEAVIIGSDAVVQHFPILARMHITLSRKTILAIRVDPIHYETNFPNPFWGEFINYFDREINVVMMSVSCQNTDYKLITRQEKRSINNMIRNMGFISVRDKRTQQLFKYISNGAFFPEITPDPVFAFNGNVLNLPIKGEILEKYKLTEKYILLSFNSSNKVSKSWLFAFDLLAKQNGFQCVALAMPGGIKFENDFDIKVDLPLDPLDWYNIIKFSSAYIGEKMHPIIVALHNCVPFFSFDHYGILRFNFFPNQKASKIYHILERANLKDYRISTIRKINYRPPSPEYVFEKIIRFNKGQCSIFAEQMKNEYKAMMGELLYKLQGNNN